MAVLATATRALGDAPARVRASSPVGLRSPWRTQATPAGPFRLHPASGCRQGFTLLELLAVVAIMAILMGLATLAFVQFGRGAAMRGSLMGVKSALVQARQYAITRRVRTTFKYGNAPEASAIGRRGYFVVATNETKTGCDVMNTNYLSPGVVFMNESDQPLPDGLPRVITFKLDGSTTSGIKTDSIRMVEEARSGTSGGALTNVVDVYPLTGRARVRE